MRAWCRALKLMGPIGIVLSAQHKHSTPAGTSTKHTQVSWLDTSTAAWFVAAVRGSLSVVGLRLGMYASPPCVGGLAFLMLMCLRWFPAFSF